MRASLSFKTFGVFSLLTATTVAVGGGAYLGMRDLATASRRVATVQEFQLQATRLELYNRSRRSSSAGASDGGFTEDLRRTEALADQVARLAPSLPGKLRPRVVNLRRHLGYVQGAFVELFTKYAADRALRTRLKELHRGLMDTLWALPPDLKSRFANEVHHLAELAEDVAEDHDAANLRLVKGIAADVRRRGPPELATAVDELVFTAEKTYLNDLGVKDRQKFLNDAARRFDEIAGDVVGAITAESAARRKRVTAAVAATVLAAGLLTLFLWRASIRHIRSFLGRVEEAAGAIRSGRYDYPAPPPRDDETGDVLALLHDLAGSLGESVRKVRESEERYRSLVEGISDWVWEVDAGGRFTYSSPAAERILGFDGAGMEGRRLSEVPGTGEPRGLAEALEAALASKAAGGAEAPARRKDGVRVVLESSWQPVFGPDGELLGLRGLSRDVTHRRQAEAEQARLRAQLLQAQKMEAIGTLTGGIAHDFNNLLQSILGHLELLLRVKGQGDPDVPKLQTVEKAARRAAELTRKLLVFGRKVESRMEPLDLNEEVLQARDLLERTIPKMISLRTALAPDLRPVLGDPVQLEQILVNLALNAKDAMPRGGVLTFETSNVEAQPGAGGGEGIGPGGTGVRLRVTDTGHGMDAETLEHVFEPFFTTKEVGKGSGLGLAIVYGIVQAHGGQIRCRSAPGKGTTFELLLPEAPVQARDVEAPILPEVRPPDGNETILLVDDEETILQSGVEILQEFGYAPLSARSGEEALAVLSTRGPVDLVVLDLNMPGMGGMQCLRELRTTAPHLRVIVASGYPPGDLREELASAGVKVFVRKPYRLDQFLGAIRKALDDGRG